MMKYLHAKCIISKREIVFLLHVVKIDENLSFHPIVAFCHKTYVYHNNKLDVGIKLCVCLCTCVHACLSNKQFEQTCF